MLHSLLRTSTSNAVVIPSVAMCCRVDITKKIDAIDGKLTLILEKINQVNSSHCVFQPELLPTPAKTNDKLTENLSVFKVPCFIY